MKITYTASEEENYSVRTTWNPCLGCPLISQLQAGHSFWVVVTATVHKYLVLLEDGFSISILLGLREWYIRCLVCGRKHYLSSLIITPVSSLHIYLSSIILSETGWFCVFEIRDTGDETRGRKEEPRKMDLGLLISAVSPWRFKRWCWWWWCWLKCYIATSVRVWRESPHVGEDEKAVHNVSCWRWQIVGMVLLTLWPWGNWCSCLCETVYFCLKWGHLSSRED